MNKFDANKLIQERVEQEAIDNICTKIARIVNRKSLYDLDSWQDIAGYATLVVNLIKKQESNNEAE